jgi:hypothetical protein
MPRNIGPSRGPECRVPDNYVTFPGCTGPVRVFIFRTPAIDARMSGERQTRGAAGPTLRKKAMKPLLAFICLALLLPACTGTDRVDDPTVGQRIDVTPQQVALQPGQNAPLAARYYDPYGIARQVAFNWASSDPAGGVGRPSGLVLANGPGQAVVQASFGELWGRPST